MTVRFSVGVDEFNITDLRVRGGGLHEDHHGIEQAQHMWDLGHWDGKPYPLSGTSVVMLPLSVVERFTRDVVKERCVRQCPWARHSDHPVLRPGRTGVRMIPFYLTWKNEAGDRLFRTWDYNAGQWSSADLAYGVLHPKDTSEIQTIVLQNPARERRIQMERESGRIRTPLEKVTGIKLFLDGEETVLTRR